jgi:hypothetical protein
MTLRRGFKSEANTIARQVREEMGLWVGAPLDPWKLAEHVAIPLLPLAALKAATPDAVNQFSSVEPGAFSAVTVFNGPSRLIVFNDTHSRARQASDLAHELSHALLQHAPIESWKIRTKRPFGRSITWPAESNSNARTLP